VFKDLQVSPDQLVLRVFKDLPVLQVPQVLKVLQVFKVLQVRLVLKVIKDLQGLLGYRDPQVHKVHPELLDHKVIKDHPD
jgi:hypothetical protein